MAATEMQKKAFKYFVEAMEEGKPVNMGKIMRKAGYSKTSSRIPQSLTKSQGWKELLAQIDDGMLLQRLREIAMDDDKRSSLNAIDMLLKLKDRYPAGKLKVSQFQEELNAL